MNPTPTPALDQALFISQDAGVTQRVLSLLASVSTTPISMGVVYPCHRESLLGAIEAAQRGLIQPVFYGPVADIKALAQAEGLDQSGGLSCCQWVEADSPEAAAQQAARDAGQGRLQALTKGSLHSDVFLHAILQHENKLSTGRLLSHCAVGFLPDFDRPLFVTDAALNVSPNVDQKREICQNAIDFALAFGVVCPKVAVLAAVETVNTKMPATLDGAILSKMADRQQIVGGWVDGPLDLDIAISPEAKQIKHIDSPVAGVADILLAPDIEAGNVIYKTWSFMGHGVTAGLVLGAKVPIILTSRADHDVSRLLSTAIAALVARKWR